MTSISIRLVALVAVGMVVAIAAAQTAGGVAHDFAPAHNYVQAALTQAKAGQAVARPTTAPYGCSLKY